MPTITTELPRILIEASQAELHATGAVPRPQVHLLAEDMARRPYIGYVVCRRFYRGDDAVAAIGDLGALPSVMKVTRLMILWEDSDLKTAMELEGRPFQMGLMLVDARFDRHTLHRYPFEPVSTGQVVDSVPTVRLQWGTPQQHEDVPLPYPITCLLRTWRELRDDDIQKTTITLQQAGYELNWVETRRRWGLRGKR